MPFCFGSVLSALRYRFGATHTCLRRLLQAPHADTPLLLQYATLLLSFREKFLTDVLYQKFCGRVPCTCASGSGYTLVQTWHATSVLHTLRLLRTFRCYPSRGYVRVHIRYMNKKKCFLPHFHSWAGGWVNPIPLKKTLLLR
jgi:hypothetical protein